MKADSLAKYSSNNDAQTLGSVPIEVLSSPSIDDVDIDWIMNLSRGSESWMTPIREYLLKYPENKKLNLRLETVLEEARKQMTEKIINYINIFNKK